jgi:hypothetical protein
MNTDFLFLMDSTDPRPILTDDHVPIIRINAHLTLSCINLTSVIPSEDARTNQNAQFNFSCKNLFVTASRRLPIPLNDLHLFAQSSIANLQSSIE